MNKDLSLLEALGYSISVIGNFPARNFIDPDSGNVLTTSELYRILEDTYKKYNALNIKLPELHHSGRNSDSYIESRADQVTRATTPQRSITRPSRGGGDGLGYTAYNRTIQAEEAQPNTRNDWATVPRSPFTERPAEPIAWDEVQDMETIAILDQQWQATYNRIIRDAFVGRTEDTPQTLARNVR